MDLCGVTGAVHAYNRDEFLDSLWAMLPCLIVYDNNQYGRWLPDFWAMLARRSFSSLQKCQQCGLNPIISQCPCKANGSREFITQISRDKFGLTSPKIYTLQSVLPASSQLVANSNLVHATKINKLLERKNLQQDCFLPCICLTWQC